MSIRHRAADQAGFALVDLLVAMAVAGLAGAVLVGLVAFAERQQAGAIRREKEREGALVLERVLRLLVDGAPPFMAGASPSSTVVGDEREMTVVSTGLPVISLPQAAPFRLRREMRGAHADIVLSWVDDAGQAQRVILAQGVSDLTFSYLPFESDRSRDRDSRHEAWQARWRAEDGALTALRMVFRFESASAPWEIVIPFRANLPAACLRNPRQAGCVLEGAGG